MAFERFIRLNEASNENGEVHINPDHVVAIIGDETEPAVRVVTVAGTEYVVVQRQPVGEEEPEPSIHTRLGGTSAKPAPPEAEEETPPAEGAAA